MARPISAYKLLPLLAAWLALGASLTEVRASYFSPSQGPGPLSASHQSILCPECHAANRRDIVTGKCISCHAPVGQKIAAKRGLHGNPKVAALPCQRCHGEHSTNRDRIGGFIALGGVAQFNHQLTDYPLLGAHQGVACDRCHPVGATAKRPSYLNTPLLCQGCHKSPHGELRLVPGGCQRCHSVKAWKPTLDPMDFNHQIDTKYPLEGQHASLACGRCHSKSQYVLSERAADCTPCHAPAHGTSILSRYRCAECHHAKVSWQTLRFDHKSTGFRLNGQHSRAACRACHRGQQPNQFEDLGHLVPLGKSPDSQSAPAVQCLGCHQHRDAHQRKFTNEQCLRCHREPGVEDNKTGKAAWRVQAAIGHAPGRPFQLSDGHNQVACGRCHAQGRYQKISLQCGPQCHADVHRAALGEDCLRCHAGGKWRAVGFDHQQSQYPLTGRHRQVACASCHPEPTYKPRPRTCGAAECHLNSDSHKGRLGNDCALCHDTAGWTSTRTGHEVSPIPFGGAHDRLPCTRCHAQGRRLSGLASACIACHQRDDLHNNSLGPRCGDCHTQHSFIGARFSHDTVGCSLRGVHRILPCVDCHKGGNYFGLSTACVSCHRDDALRALGDPRLGGNATVASAHLTGSIQCSDCHNVASFRTGSRAHGAAGDSVCQ